MRNLPGMIPPQAVEVEDVVLGALMLEKEALLVVVDVLKPDAFYHESNKKVYEAILSISRNGRSVDIMTVVTELKSQGNLEAIGGAYYITSLTNRVASGANIEEYAFILQQKYLQRELIRTCSEYIQKAYSDTEDVFELYDTLSDDLFKKVAVNVGKEPVVISDILSERMKVYSEPATTGLTGLSSGFKSVDDITGGWQNTDLIIIAARPGMGKTAFALNLARHAGVRDDQAVAIFSLEMSKEQLVDRMVSAETEIYFDKIKHRRLTEYDHASMMKMTQLINSKIFIDDSASTPIQSLRAKATRLKHKHDIGLIVVDYLQLMKGDKETKGNREQEVASISRGLKAIAKELNVPVIALSQLSRALESRPGINGKRPILSDLRESGSLEQDADQIVFLFRPEYYGITEDEAGRSLIGISEAIFAKNRHGELDTAVLRFNGAMMKFSDLEDELPDTPTDLAIRPNENFDRTAETIIKPSKSGDDSPLSK